LAVKSSVSGVLAAVLSTALGGTAIVATRFLAGAADPITIGVLRFGGGAVLLLPFVLIQREQWPRARDWPAATGLGLLFFALFPVLFNAALIDTTAARGALALSTTPLITMLVAALLRIEPLTARKSLGLGLALGGVVTALAASLPVSPPGAWRGDALMLAGAACMALYTVWSRPLIRRSGPIAFAVTGMVIGAACLGAVSWATGGIAAVVAFGGLQWAAALYLAVVCGAGLYYLWSVALGTVSPTLVALTVTVNPITAALFGALLLGEPIRLSLVVGLLGVAAGIWVAAGLRAPVVSQRQP
jgi:drug/metabolite transporter (DMT)-like permease